MPQPWHLNAFVPRYRMRDRAGTDPALLVLVAGSAYARGLRHVYVGNVADRARELVAAGTLGRIVLTQAQWAFGVRGRRRLPPRTPLTQWWDTPELIGARPRCWARRALGRTAALGARRRGGRDHGRHQRPDSCAPARAPACLTLCFGNGTLGLVVASRLLPDSRNDFRVYEITGLIAGHHSHVGSAYGSLRDHERHRQRDHRLPRKRCCRTTWQRSRTSSGPSPPGAGQQRPAWTGCASWRSCWR